MTREDLAESRLSAVVCLGTKIKQALADGWGTRVMEPELALMEDYKREWLPEIIETLGSAYVEKELAR